MNILDIITKKKNNGSLSYEELEYAFMGYLNKEIPDYQMSSLLMAITINGMSLEETVDLTEIFIKSGATYDIASFMDNTVDKHSTGGVGDSTTLVVGPICAALGLKMVKMSGRGLGLTGGTIDKLESIPGFNVNLTKDEMIGQVKKIGFALSSQTEDLTPLDKVIYALRDVTGTTESIPLIASSIMSKKLAIGAKNILIDVKYGSGALMKTKKDAQVLSEWLCTIGEKFNRNVKTIISDMNKPLSNAVGNALEVVEAIDVLHGKTNDLANAAIEIVATLYSMATKESFEKSLNKTYEVLKNGKALECFYQFIKAQGGKLKDLVISENVINVKAKKDGIVAKVDAMGAAKLAAKLGASKMKLDDKIDYSVGILLCVSIGDDVKKGDTLVKLYTNKEIDFDSEDFDFIKID